MSTFATFARSGSVPATTVQWGTATGTWTQQLGWTCDACKAQFCGVEGKSRQKRKLEQHVTHKQHPCTKQAQARATRASTATMGAPKALNPSLQPVNHQVAMLNSDDGWKLTQPPVAQLREPWSKHLEPGHAWVFVCRKAFDPTSAQEWFKDSKNTPKVHPQGPWETVDGGRSQCLWAADGIHGKGPCDDFYKAVHNYLGSVGECREYLYAQVCADSVY
jgi:hypothetical protein